MQEDNQYEPKVLKTFSKERTSISKNKILTSLLVILLGIGSGFFLSKNSLGAEISKKNQPSDNLIKTETEAGVNDNSVFSETEAPIGILSKGGTEGEGTHHLERPGGKSQNVYLTSTVIDLDSFDGKKVQVWGETLSALKAGWLMDVAKVKVVN